MIQALVIGVATSIVKHESLTGIKLLVAVPVTSKKGGIQGDPFILFDRLGAGIGDLVLATSDGSYTSIEIIGTTTTPARLGTLGFLTSESKMSDEF